MESLEYIDGYFTGEQTSDEKAAFEARVKEDKEFAEEVAFYLSVLQTVRELNIEDKKDHFRKIYLENRQHGSNSGLKKLWPYLAAAVVFGAFLVGLSYFIHSPQPARLAEKFIDEHLQSIGVKMSADLDNLEKGKMLYNEKKYSNALNAFEQVTKNDTANYEAVEFAGMSALQSQDLNKALVYFSHLENAHALHVNPGKFYHALTLMKRNGPGDVQLAKKLLHEVIEQNLSGRQDAEIFLKEF